MRILGASLFILILSACTGPRQQNAGNGSATFIAKPVTATSREGEVNEKWRFPLSRDYDFKVCVEDIGSKSAMRGAEFTLALPDGPKKVTSDVEGCLVWTERVKFNFLARSTVLNWPRTLTASGTHRGSITLRLALNPWAPTHDANEPAFYDLSQTPVAEELLSDVTEKPSVAELLVKKMDYSLSEIPSDRGLEFRAQFVLEPVLVLKSLAGKNVELPLIAGSFNLEVDAHLKEANRAKPGGFERYSLFKRPVQAESTVIGQRLRSELGVTIDSNQQRGEAYFVVNLVPLDPPRGLRGFQAEYAIGNPQNLLNGGSAGLIKKTVLGTPDTGGQASASIDPTEPPPAQAARPRVVSEDRTREGYTNTAPYEFKPLAITFKVFDPEFNFTTKRRVRYEISTTVENPATHKALQGLEFEIFKTNNQKITMKTSPTGVLKWTESIEHDVYEPEAYRKLMFRLKKGAFTKNFTIYVNPWTTGGGFGLDERFTDEIPQAPASRQSNTLSIRAWGLTAHRYQYALDHDLKLTVKRQFDLTMGVFVNRFDSLSNDRTSEAARPGLYLVRYFYYRSIPNGPRIFRYATSGKQIVSTASGVLSPSIVLNFDDERILKTQIAVILEVEPIDETKLTKAERAQKKIPDGKDPEDYVAKDSRFPKKPFLTIFSPGENAMGTSPIAIDSLPGDDCAGAACANAQRDLFRDVKMPPGGFRKMTIAHLEKQKIEWDREKQEERDKNRALKNFIALNNLEYAPVKGSTIGENRLSESDARELGQAYRNASDFLKDFNKTINVVYGRNSTTIAPAEPSELKAVTVSGGFSALSSRRMCHYFVDYLWARKAKNISVRLETAYKNSSDDLLRQCLRSATDNGAAHVFHVDRKLRTYKVKSFLVTGGSSVSLNVGSDFGYSHSQSVANSVSVGVAGADILKPLGVVGSLVTGLGLSVGAGKSWSWSQSVGGGTHVSSGISLAADQKTVEMTVLDREECSVVRFQPSFLLSRPFIRDWAKDASGEEVSNLVTRGLFICTGEIKKEPQRLKENYFYLSPFIFSSPLLDGTDISNLPWLLAVRGNHDYAKLVASLQAQECDGNAAGICQTPAAGDVKRYTDLVNTPHTTLRSSYNQMSPSFPGLYTLPVEGGGR